MEIALGTVQLGLPYGNKAHLGAMSEHSAFEILDFAVDSGITFYDTAIAYGLSEERIGKFRLAEKSPRSTISTKIPVAAPDLWKNEDTYWTWMLNHLAESCMRLGIQQHGLLQFHQCDLDFLNSRKTAAVFKRLVGEGKCREIGVSVYTVEQGMAALDTKAVHAIQVPANLIDTRFLCGEFQNRARAQKITLIGRSLFLQGILIESTPLPMARRQSELVELRRLAVEAANGESLQELSFRGMHINWTGSLDYLLLGIDSVDSLRQNLLLYKGAKLKISESTAKNFAAVEAHASQRGLLNPANWNS